MSILQINEYPSHNEVKIVLDETYVLKYTDKVYFIESSNPSINLDRINIMLSNITQANISFIIKQIINELHPTNELNLDSLCLFSSSKPTKHKLSKSLLYENYIKNAPNKIKPSQLIPNNLQLTSNQLFEMIYSEIEKVNCDMTHNNYIKCNNNNIFELSFLIRYREGPLAIRMKQFSEIYNYDYFEILFTLNNLYPFVAPTIQYNRPVIDINLVNSILTLETFNQSNWSYTITMDWIIRTLEKALEPHFLAHLDFDNVNNNLDNEPFTYIDKQLLQLGKILKLNKGNTIEIPVFKFTDLSKTTSLTWASGTGYGNNSNTTWNIKDYIDMKQLYYDDICNILTNIYNYMEANPDFVNSIIVVNFIYEKFDGINLLEFNNNIKLYNITLKLINFLLEKSLVESTFIQRFIKYTMNLYDEVLSIVSNTSVFETIDIDIKTNYTVLLKLLDNIRPSTTKVDTLVITTDIIEQYKNMVSSEQFKKCDLFKNHRFFSQSSQKINQKTILRIVSEITSLKKDLPNYWDSSVLIRISNDINIITFAIVGPKDTPYHNGVFEFHAYFPDGYPASIPKVLLYTNDNGKVRFNPNLYAHEGKVCLSLLGTWNGQQGESWNPGLSTFLQVIISIQSLIFVDNPYFNEPSYEKTMKTEQGIAASSQYNDKVRLDTIRVAMIDQLKNPAHSYESFIANHFKLKRDEILSTVNTWLSESTKYKTEMAKLIEELKTLLFN